MTVDASSAAIEETTPPGPTRELAPRDHALVRIGHALRRIGYRFTTITPLSHRRVLERSSASVASMRDIFGWNRPFAASDLPEPLLTALQQAEAVQTEGDRLRATVRFSTLQDQLFVHSPFPTEQADAVFFGPDTYRFARAIEATLATMRTRRGLRILDVGAGSGAGGLHAAQLLAASRPAVLLTDINRRALRFSRINALINAVPEVETAFSDLYAEVKGSFDLIVSNPPYLVDPLARLYRHGGGAFGAELSISIAQQGIAHLAPGGRLLLYTGSAIVNGDDLLEQALRDRLAGERLSLRYEEIDPDVFGEELDASPYDKADRIAVVAVTVQRDEG